MAVDLPRLIPGVSIYVNEEKQTLPPADSELGVMFRIKALLEILTKQLDGREISDQVSDLLLLKKFPTLAFGDSWSLHTI